MAEQKFIKADELRRFCRQAFGKAGMRADDAELAAQLLVETDLRGVDTHGAARLSNYINSLREGIYNPRPNIQMVKESAIHALFDGDGGLGHVVASKAMRWCVDRAKEGGFAMAAVRNSTHFGAASLYAMMAGKEDLIGFSCTNVSPTMAPPGSSQSTHGNNPIAYAIPAGAEPMLVLDMAMSVKALGNVFNARREGRKMPLGWALDKEGNPTDDPNAAVSLVPFGDGGYKGFGLALVVDVLAGVLTGANFGRRFPHGRPPTDAGHFFMAIDPQLFMPLDEFKRRVDETLRMAKDAPRRADVKRIYAPGEPELETKERRLREGIPIPPGLWAQLEKVGKDLGVDLVPAGT